MAAFEAVAWLKYHIDCPNCLWEIQLDWDPQGKEVKCGDCGVHIRMTETR